MASRYRVHPAPREVSLVGTAGATTTDAVTGVTTGMSWAVVSGATYRLVGHASFTSAASTTCPQFAFLRTAGTTLTAASLSAVVTGNATAAEHSNTNSTTDGFTAGGTGPGAGERPVTFSGLLVVNAGGRITLQMKSEVGGSAVTMARGVATLTRIT